MRDDRNSADDDTLAAAAGAEPTLAAGSGGGGDRVTVRAGAQDDYAGLVAVDPQHYVVGAEIAKGGMGRIVVARDRRLGRAVAIKQLLVPTGELRPRFEREARITAKLQHPAIVNILEAGAWPNGEPFYAMKLVSGESLDKVIAGRKTLDERLGLLPTVIAVVDALAYAHSQRVIHRDLKPANVLVGGFGETVVIDWGLAKDLSDTSGAPDLPAGPYRTAVAPHGATVDGAVMGTPAYMPPEQALGEPVDERADVYALGAMLYHVLAGEPPYLGRTSEATLAKVVAGPPPLIVERVNGVPHDLATIVTRAMARGAADRPTAADLGEELRRFQTGKLVAAHVYSTWDLVRRFVVRHRAVVGVIAAAVVIIGVLATIAVRRIMGERALAQAGRADAQRQRAVAEERVGELLQEQGRQELLAGSAQRAAVLLAAAYAQSATPSPALRFLTAAAARGVQRRLRTIDGVVVAGRDGALIVRDGTGLALTSTAEPGRRRALATALPDGAHLSFEAGGALVAARADRRAWLFDARDGHALAAVDHGAEIADLAVDVHADRILLLTGGADAVARLWDGRSGAVVRAFTPSPPGDVEDGVSAVALTAGGTRVAIGRSSGEPGVLWDGATGRVLGSLEMATQVAFIAGDTRLLHSAVGSSFLADAATGTIFEMIGDHFSTDTVSPDGKRILIAGQGEPQIIDAATAKTVATLFKPSTLLEYTDRIDVGDQAFSPDGTRVAMVSNAGPEAWICDAGSGELVVALAGHRDRVDGVAYSADGRRLVTASVDGTVKLWEAATGRMLTSIDPGVMPEDAWFEPGDATIAVRSPGRVDVYAATADALVATVLGDRAAYTRDGAALVVAGGTVARVLDGTSGALRHTLEGHRASIVALAVDDVGHAVTGAKDGGVRVWSLASGDVMRTVEHGGPLAAAATTADGSVLASAGGNLVRLWDVGTGAQTFALEHPFEVDDVRFDPGGQRLLVRDRVANAWLWDVRQGRIIERYASGDEIFRDAVFSPDGALLATCAGRKARLWNATTGAMVAAFELDAAHPADAYIYQLELSRDGRWLVIETSVPPLHIVDVGAGRIASTLDGVGRIDGTMFSPDSRLLATQSGDGAARLYEVATGRLVTHIPHDDGVHGIWFTHGGSFLVTTSEGTLRVWDAAGRLLGALPSRFASTTLPHHLALHPGGTRLAGFESEYQTEDQFRIWDLALEGRRAAAVEAEVAARAPWRLVDLRLVPAAP